MIPLKDNNPTSSFPIITILLIVLNSWIYFTQPDQFKSFYEMIPADVTSGHAISGILHQSSDGHLHFQPAPEEYVRQLSPNSTTDIPILPTIQPTWLSIFTAMFLHANFLHLAGNMLFLWIFGNNVEDAMGKPRFLAFYLGCGFVAALTQIAVDPNSLIPTLGASGAIAGVLGAYILMWPDAKVLTVITALFIWFLREISAFWVIGIWIVLQILEGYFRQGGEATGGVAYFAHIGGFFCGVILTILMGGKALGQKAVRAARYSSKY